jgi:hypothetical protein
MAPFQVFLVANLIFFSVQSLSGLRIFSNPLRSQLNEQFYERIAQGLVTARLAATHRSVDQYAPVFDHAARVNAKSFIILMTVPLTILTLLVFRRSRQPFVVHVVFALHFVAFEALMLCALVPVGLIASMLGASTGSRGQIDVGTAYTSLALNTVVLYLAIGRVFGVAGVRRVVAAAVLTVANVLVFYGYRFTVFVITLYTT